MAVSSQCSIINMKLLRFASDRFVQQFHRMDCPEYYIRWCLAIAGLPDKFYPFFYLKTKSRLYVSHHAFICEQWGWLSHVTINPSVIFLLAVVLASTCYSNSALYGARFSNCDNQPYYMALICTQRGPLNSSI